MINNLSPDYLATLAIRATSTRRRDNLRSSNDTLKLKLPESKSTHQYKLCEHWNDLPLALRDCNSIDTFKKDLKTHYYRLAYS